MKRSLLIASGMLLAGSGALSQTVNFHAASQGYSFYGGYNVLYYGQGAYSDPGNNVWNGFGQYGGPGSTDFYGVANTDSGHGSVPNGNPGNPYAWYSGITSSGSTLFSPTDSGAGNVGNATSAGQLSSITLSMTYGSDSGSTGGTVQGEPSWIFGHAAVVNPSHPGAGTAANPMGVATLLNVPPGTYDLFLYGANFDGTRGASFTVNSGTALNGMTSTINPNAAAGSGPLTSFVLGQTYVEFTGVTPDANGDITIDWVPVSNPNSGLTGEGDFNGLQIEEVISTNETGSLVYQGLTNTSLGVATLAVAGSELVVSNLGSSGQDGVSIALPGNLTALEVNYEPLDVSNTLPVGSYVEGETIGTDNGITNSVLGTVAMTKVGTTNYIVSADFSAIGASSYTVQAYLNGVLAGQATNLQGSSLAMADVDCISVDNEGYTTSFGWNTNQASVYLGSATVPVICDHLYVIPQDVSVSNAPTAFQITASQVTAITITRENESLLYGGLTNTSLGHATLAVAGSQLIVSNLGSSGQDGVSLALPSNLTALDLHWLPLDLSNTLPIGSYVQGQTIGTAYGITNGVLGTATMTKVGTTSYLVSADFSAVGASNYTVQAYLNGVLAGQATNLQGSSLALADLDCISVDTAGYTMTFGWGTNPATLYLGSATVAVICDHLYVIPQNVSVPNAPAAFQVTAFEMPLLNVAAVTVSPLVASLSYANQNVTLQWFGTGIPQVSSDLMNWSGVSGATSPYTVPMSSTNQFFRISQTAQ